MSKKWILYIGGFDMPDNNAASQRVVGNAKAFRDLGYDVFFIGFSRTKKLCDTVSEFENFNYVNLHYPKKLKEWYLYLSSINQYKNYLENQPDIIIAYNFPAIALNKLRKWSIKKNIHIIADCTEWYEAKGNIFFRLIKNIDTIYRMKIIHPKMDGMIAISDFLYDYYSQRMKNVVNIPPLVDLEMEKWNQINNKVESDFINIVFAGSFGKGNKERFDKVLEVLSQIKAENNEILFFFNVIGESRTQYLKIFSTEIPYNLEDNICFKGRLSHENTLNEIKQAHFSLFLRDNNLVNSAGFPTKFVEAISAGTPVLTNSISNINNYLQEGKYGFLLNSESIESLKNSLKEALQLPMKNIYEMKRACIDSQLFFFKNFIPVFDTLIMNL